MISALHEPPRQLLHEVPWHTYEFFLHKFDGENLRITYDNGDLEIMTLSHEHESFGELLGHFIVILCMELNFRLHLGGSTTIKRAALAKGLEPDKCYWLKNERHMCGKKEFDIDVDPPPDLAIEVDITHSSLDRMGIYASLGVPEVWRFDGETLQVFVLGANGKYKEKSQSQAFPFLPMPEITRFLAESRESDDLEVLRSFSQWVRETLVPQIAAGKSKKNGKKSAK